MAHSLLFCSSFQAAATIKSVRGSLIPQSSQYWIHMFYQRKMFFIHYSGDSNYYPGDQAQHCRLFLVLSLYQLFSVVTLQKAVNLLHFGFLFWTPKLSWVECFTRTDFKLTIYAPWLIMKVFLLYCIVSSWCNTTAITLNILQNCLELYFLIVII